MARIIGKQARRYVTAACSGLHYFDLAPKSLITITLRNVLWAQSAHLA